MKIKIIIIILAMLLLITSSFGNAVILNQQSTISNETNEEDCGCGGTEIAIDDSNIIGDKINEDTTKEYYFGFNGHEPPKDLEERANLNNDNRLVVYNLPDSFDWRSIGASDYTTPIKNQSDCGSCWAFATVGPLESNIKIRDGDEVDLSEQWLVSCNQEGWGCDGGSGWAHDYHEWKADPCGGVGAGAARGRPAACRALGAFLPGPATP